ncbi:MAG TPA: M14 family zinc carboxypeptidase [Devosiaceae bacterium]|nr:M14 family zinc carboxypeptidase [Devosiaceae bacterium]
MTVIVDFTAPSTLDALVERIAALKPAGLVEAWLFEDREARRAAERTLAAEGISAKFRSAYKPLIHFFTEEASLDGIAKIVVRYPVVAGARAKRFRLEAYPLAGMVDGAPLELVAEEGNATLYKVELTDADGNITAHEVFAPNRLHPDHMGEEQLSPTGWLRIASAEIDEPVSTDFEAVYARAMDAIAGYDFGTTAPLFEELNIRVSLPARDQPLPVGDEAISLIEAMHEDLYFSVLEIFQSRLGSGRNDHHGRPGHIVPEVVLAKGPASVRVETRPLAVADPSVPRQQLATATHPIGVDQIRAELEGIGEIGMAAESRAGRLVMGRYKAGSDAGVVISSGQHANETTGPIGALRAAQILTQRPEANFAISPLENPDGYALHHRLRVENANHMHHAARYTALGDDVESRKESPVFESLIRQKQFALMEAKLHLNLHGYPSHEWTRPLSGYLPQGFELWTLPKGFFLVMRHHADWAETAEKLTTAVTEKLAENTALIAYNRRQIEIYEAHAGPASTFRVINGVPCSFSSDFKHQFPLTLITEFPDETVYGDEFILGHTAQMETTLAAYDAYQKLMG